MTAHPRKLTGASRWRLALRNCVLPAALLGALGCSSNDHPTKIGPGASTAVAPAETLASSPRRYVAASLLALPGADCDLHPTGNPDPAQAIPVLVDDDGVARFYAVRASEGDKVQSLTLDCTDETGKTASYPIDLRSEAVFQERPFDVDHATGTLRAALTGDPLARSREDLVKSGYGLRPDPSTRAYDSWLRAASRATRMVRSHHRQLDVKFGGSTPNNVTYGTSGNWGGGILVGDAPYVEASEDIVIGEAIPGGDGVGASWAAVWGGLGGDNDVANNAGLIQSGSAVFTTSTSASYWGWREYCCGEGGAHYNGVQALLPVNQGDTVYSEQWACDSGGNTNVNGGYGCFYIEDVTTGGSVNCVSPTDPTCPSLPATSSFPFSGNSAEFIFESPNTAVPDTFCCTAITAARAYSTKAGAWVGFETDPQVDVWTLVSPSGVAIEEPTLMLPDEVQFTFNEKSE